MSGENKMHNAVRGSNFNFANHNETNFEAFNEFKNDLEKKYESMEKDKVLRERRNNLVKWDKSLPERWSGASLSKMANPNATKLIELYKKRGPGSLYVHGPVGSGKTYLAYGYIRKYIGSGLTTPSRVKIISEENILSLAHTGFEGKNQFERIFDKKYNVYLIDNFGSRETYNSKNEVPMLERLIDHIYNNSLTAIFTSTEDPNVVYDFLSDSTATKLGFLVENGVVQVDKWGNNPTSNFDRDKSDSSSRDKEIFDAFSG